MRGLKSIPTAQALLDGWLVHYNFFRPHMSLNDSTPASVAGIRFPHRNWKDVCEQPFEITARIPMRTPEPEPVTNDELVMPVKKPVVRHKKMVGHKSRSRESIETSISVLRTKR